MEETYGSNKIDTFRKKSFKPITIQRDQIKFKEITNASKMLKHSENRIVSINDTCYFTYNIQTKIKKKKISKKKRDNI